jgi:hypothetical protein
MNLSLNDPQSQLAAQIELKNVERNVQIYRSIDIKKAGHNPERVPKMYESFYGRHHAFMHAASKSASKENTKVAGNFKQ